MDENPLLNGTNIMMTDPEFLRFYLKKCEATWKHRIIDRLDGNKNAVSSGRVPRNIVTLVHRLRPQFTPIDVYYLSRIPMGEENGVGARTEARERVERTTNFYA